MKSGRGDPDCGGLSVLFFRLKKRNEHEWVEDSLSEDAGQFNFACDIVDTVKYKLNE